MFNTCIEKAMNFISMEEHPEIRFIKDVAAGAVLIASATALIIGLLIFIPKIFNTMTFGKAQRSPKSYSVIMISVAR